MEGTEIAEKGETRLSRGIDVFRKSQLK
jgi:hypothetical protein